MPLLDKDIEEMQTTTKYSLIARNRLLEQRYAKLLEDYNNLEIKYNRTSGLLLDARVENDRLRPRLADFVTRYSSMIACYTRLQSDNHRLQVENDSLRERIHLLSVIKK